MRCAIISDIHSNLEALTAVFAVIDGMTLDAVFCLGDIVGYGADPDACVDMALARSNMAVRGNHDKAVAGLLNLDWFNHAAREAALWTRRACLPETLEKVKRLEEGPRDAGEGILLCHGAPFNEDVYIVDQESVSESYRCLDERFPGARFCLHGHTHVPLVIAREGEKGRPRLIQGTGGVDLRDGATYLINPGSVGQPRDGNPLASFGILDTTGMAWTNLRVAYSVRDAQRKILQAGIPPQLAERLAEGM